MNLTKSREFTNCDDGFIKGFSHITGGGIVENIKRILNDYLTV